MVKNNLNQHLALSPLLTCVSVRGCVCGRVSICVCVCVYASVCICACVCDNEISLRSEIMPNETEIQHRCCNLNLPLKIKVYGFVCA